MIYSFESREYYAGKIERAKIERELIVEAIDARINDKKVKADAAELAMYADIIKTFDENVKTATADLDKFIEREAAENAAKADTADTEGDNA